MEEEVTEEEGADRTEGGSHAEKVVAGVKMTPLCAACFQTDSQPAGTQLLHISSVKATSLGQDQRNRSGTFHRQQSRRLYHISSIASRKIEDEFTPQEANKLEPASLQ